MSEVLVAKRWSWLLVLTCVVFSMGWLTWQLEEVQDSSGGGVLTVHFLDVGQGAATLIETPEGQQVLIDGGVDSLVLQALARHVPWYDRSLDMVIATHPDTDHVGGLVDVLHRYQVNNILWNGQISTGAAATAFYGAVEAETGAAVQLTAAGQSWQIGASTTIEVYAPRYRPQRIPANAGSVVLRIKYGETSILLPGDVPKEIERFLVQSHGTALASTVLQLGHHGSDTSTDSLFLQTVSPELAIVSAGADNSYGHPSIEVLERVSQIGLLLLSTADVGTITLKSNGSKLWRH